MVEAVHYISNGVIFMVWAKFLWEFYLTWRQYKVYVTAVEVPYELKGILIKETYDKARVYGLDKSRFSMVFDVYNILLSTAFIKFFFVLFWMMSKNTLVYLEFEPNEILQSALFVLIMNTINTITGLPWSIYSTFWLEEKHGFNKQTVGFYIKDKIKAYILSQVLIIPLSCAAVYIIKNGGDYFFFYLWLFLMMTILFLMTIYPDFIAPLFDKYTPLPDGELKTKIEELAASVNFPLYKLYIVEGSKRSVHSNAYFYGFFKNKRIVLFDTLVKGYTSEDNKGCETEEILAVLAHELGHWKLNHVLKYMIIMQVNLFIQIFAFGYLFKYTQLYRAFGFIDEEPILVGFIIVMQFVFLPYECVISFLTTVLSRKFEFEADTFGKSLGKAYYLKNALIKLHQDNLTFPVYDWLYSTWHHSHPPLLERLAHLTKKEE